MQPSGSGIPHAGASTRGSPIDVDLGSDNLGEPLELDADLEGVGNLDLAGDKMDEDEGSEKGTPPPADRSEFTMVSTGRAHSHGGPHSPSQRRYHPHYHG
jgi:hypothetical protein